MELGRVTPENLHLWYPILPFYGDWINGIGDPPAECRGDTRDFGEIGESQRDRSHCSRDSHKRL